MDGDGMVEQKSVVRDFHLGCSPSSSATVAGHAAPSAYVHLSALYHAATYKNNVPFSVYII